MLIRPEVLDKPRILALPRGLDAKWRDGWQADDLGNEWADLMPWPLTEFLLDEGDDTRG